MMLFVLAFVLPLAYACPEQPECDAATHMLCPGPPPPANAPAMPCPPAGSCLPRGKGTDGNPCPNPCPMHCNEHQIMCPMPPVNGCPMPAFCLEMPPPPAAGAKAACPVTCPLHCDNGFVHCPGAPDANGCLSQGECKATC